MSEFTDCIYLRAETHRAGIDWLKRHRMRGYIMRAEDGWCQVMPEWPYDSERVREALRGTTETLVHYQFAADHLWAFAIYVGGTRAFRYACSWDGKLSFDVDGSIEVASRKLKVSKESLDEILYTGNPETTHAELVASAAKFCSLVGLRNHSWAAFRYVNKGGPAMLVQPARTTTEEPRTLDLNGLSGVLARLSISYLVQHEKIVFDPDTRHIRENLARHLVDELEEFSTPSVSELASSWHRAIRRSPMIARLRFEPDDLEDALHHFVSQTDTGRSADRS